MTTEEKAKAYDEAIERAKNFIENGDERERTISESIFAGIMEESEDERYLSYAIHAVEDMLGNNGKNTVTWLKSLKERYTWKPSDRELGAILTAIGDERKKGSDVAKELLNIYQQLKKLREE